MKKLVNANLKSVEDMLKRMIDGERFYFGSEEYFYVPGKDFRLAARGLSFTKSPMDVTYLMDVQLDQVLVEADAPWYENIPEGGVLCWPSNHNATAKMSPSIISSYDSDRKIFISIHDLEWKYATPVKPEDCLQESIND